MFIYVIVCSESLKIYIGQHKYLDLQTYLNQKWYRAYRADQNPHSHLYNAMRKHPRESWSIHPLISGIESKAELDEWEQLLIYACKSQHPEVGYNLCDGGEGFTGNHSDLSKIKVSASLKSFYQSPEAEETKQRLRAVVQERQARREFIGRPAGYEHTPEAIEKMRQKAREKMNTEKGRAQLAACVAQSLSPEARAKISVALTGRPSPLKGVPRSDDLKAKLRAANLGKHRSEETKQKLSAVLRGAPGRHKGIPVSEETKRKISETLKARHARLTKETEAKEIE